MNTNIEKHSNMYAIKIGYRIHFAHFIINDGLVCCFCDHLFCSVQEDTAANRNSRETRFLVDIMTRIPLNQATITQGYECFLHETPLKNYRRISMNFRFLCLVFNMLFLWVHNIGHKEASF